MFYNNEEWQDVKNLPKNKSPWFSRNQGGIGMILIVVGLMLASMLTGPSSASFPQALTLLFVSVSIMVLGLFLVKKKEPS